MNRSQYARPRSDTRWLVERPIAHRGLHDEARPENSLSAFEAAAVAGYPIELDVHLSSDAKVVVLHDSELQRMTGREGTVATTTLAALQAMPLLGSSEKIPSLDDVLDVVAGRVPVLVEIKNDAEVGALEALVTAALFRYRHACAAQSFNPLSVAWLRRYASSIPRGLLSGAFGGSSLARYKKFLLKRLLLAPYARPDFIGYELGCMPHWAPTLAKRIGIPVLAWTIRTADQQRRGEVVADNIIFETIRP